MELEQPYMPVLPWEVRGRGLPDDEFEFSLFQDGRQTGQLVCPSIETPAAWDVLRGLEYPLPQIILDIVKGMPVLDIGAHVGSASLYFDAICEPDRIISFEPSPRCCEYIKRNSRGKKHGLVEAAVAGATGTALLFDQDRGALFVNSLFPGEKDSEDRATQVQVVSGVDALRAVDGDIGVLKIDAEGCGVPLLLSAAYDLYRVHVLFIEYHSELHRRLLDGILRGFSIFYSKGVATGQGVLGYLNQCHWKKIRSHELSGVRIKPLETYKFDAQSG